MPLFNPPASGSGGAVDSVNGQTGAVTLDPSDFGSLNAGLLTGGACTVAGTDLDVDITAGTGVIGDTLVTWGAGSIALTNPDGGFTQHYIYVDSAGTFQLQLTPPTIAERRTRIFLCRAFESGGVATLAPAFPNPASYPGVNLFDIATALGPIRIGMDVTAAATDLSIARSAGSIVALGKNWANDETDPNRLAFAEDTEVTFQHATQDGSVGADRTQLDPLQYDNAGTLTTVPANNDATIMTVIMFESGAVRVLYGQGFYANLNQAIERLSAYSPTIPAAFSEGFILGFIVLRKDATDLSDTGDGIFVPANKLGELGGGTAVLTGYLEAASNLSDVDDVDTARGNLAAAPLTQTINAQTGTTYTPVLGDNGALVTLSNAASITVTLPQDSDVAIPVGGRVDFAWIGVGDVTFVAGTGATMNVPAAFDAAIAEQYGMASGIKVAADTWLIVGYLAEAVA